MSRFWYGVVSRFRRGSGAVLARSGEGFVVRSGSGPGKVRGVVLVLGFGWGFGPVLVRFWSGFRVRFRVRVCG